MRVTESNKSKSLINVCGAGRSGTTMLDLMLGNDSKAFSCGEIYAWFRPWRKHHSEVVCSCEEVDCSVWQDLNSIHESNFHKWVCEATGANYVIDSSKELCWVLDSNIWASKNGIRVHNILLWKDPVDLAFSYWKRGWSVERCKKSFINYYEHFFSLNIPFISVSLNELVMNPEKKLKDICQLIGMDWYEGKEKFWNKEHHHLFGSSGTRKQREAGNSRIQSSKYPKEFEDEINSIKVTFEQDVQVKNIIRLLLTKEVSIIEKDDLVAEHASFIRPWWYHYRRLKQRVRKYYPAREPDYIIQQQKLKRQQKRR